MCTALLYAKLLDRQPTLSEFTADHNVDGDFLLYAGKDSAVVMEGSSFILNYVHVMRVIMSHSSCFLGQEKGVFPLDEVFDKSGADITKPANRTAKVITLKAFISPHSVLL